MQLASASLCVRQRKRDNNECMCMSSAFINSHCMPIIMQLDIWFNAHCWLLWHWKHVQLYQLASIHLCTLRTPFIPSAVKNVAAPITYVIIFEQCSKFLLSLAHSDKLKLRFVSCISQNTYIYIRFEQLRIDLNGFNRHRFTNAAKWFNTHSKKTIHSLSLCLCIGTWFMRTSRQNFKCDPVPGMLTKRQINNQFGSNFIPSDNSHNYILWLLFCLLLLLL